jgi:hypothetical protein
VPGWRWVPLSIWKPRGYALAISANWVPFCESPGDHRLSALAIEGEKHLRIDYSQSYRAYLKTYDGEGSETFFLAIGLRFILTLWPAIVHRNDWLTHSMNCD